MRDVIIDLTSLFDEAKSSNELEFVITLINYRGIGDPKLATNLYEWFEAIEFYKSLYAQLKGKEKTRIAALLYSTFFENSDFYNIIGSLCRIKLGYKGSSYLFHKTKKYERLLGIGEKQEYLLELLYDVDKNHIIDFFETNHFKEIRNTFFHSAYTLTEDEYILHDSQLIYIENGSRSHFNIKDFFYPIIENVIIFFNAFKDLYLSSHANYSSDKMIKGYFPDLRDIIILGNSEGLQGFKAPKSVQIYGEWHDSGIWYDERFDLFTGHNIRFDSPTIETVEINEQLTRYEKKDDIHQSDVEFHNLVDKISDRERPTEIQRATLLLLNFGLLRQNKMEQESNHFKKRSYPKYIIPFYKKAIEIGSNLFDTTPIKQEIEKLINYS